MKINKYISIDEEIFRHLSRETNASDLINELLKAHYNKKSFENVEILMQKYAEIKQINKENHKKEKELFKKIDNLKQKNKDFFEIFKKAYPKELVDKLKKIDNLDYEAALILSKKFDLHERGIGGVKLIKIWEEIKKNDLGK
jgi:predicted CopG family antitoxin